MKTATEWLCEQWLYLDSEFDMMLIDKKIYWEKLRELQVKAKQMEKQQIIDANDSGFADGVTDRDDGIMRFKTAEKYYNETYGKDKSED
jgi:S-adenosylmethionine synthetase